MRCCVTASRQVGDRPGGLGSQDVAKRIQETVENLLVLTRGDHRHVRLLLKNSIIRIPEIERSSDGGRPETGRVSRLCSTIRGYDV